MSMSEGIVLGGCAVAVVVMLLVTQTKERVSWSAWLVPALTVPVFAVWTGIVIARERLFGFNEIISGSLWGLQLWFDRLLSVTAGIKSDVWIIFVIVTGSIGLLAMLARTVYLERRNAR